MRSQILFIQFVRVPQHHVTHKLLLAGHVFPQSHNSRLDFRRLHEHSFNLRKLDTVAANLYLRINPPEKLDLAARHPSSQIAGPVQAQG